MKRLVVLVLASCGFSGIATCVAHNKVFASTTPRALITIDDCFQALAANDVNEDDRINRPEYVDLVNDLGDDAWSNISAYNQLPPFLRSVFLDLYFESSNSSSSSDQGVSFDVFGSKPNQVANTTQQQFLTNVVCTKIPAAIRTLLKKDDDTNTTATMAPTVSPSNESFNETQCFTDLATADADTNNFLDTQEYVVFVQDYSSITLQFDAFEEMPLLLRANFLSLASDETNIFKVSEESDIRIFGVHANQTARPKQYKYLQLVCRQTNQVLNVVEEMKNDKPSPTAAPQTAKPTTSTPTDSPAPTTTPSPTLSPTTTPVPTTVPVNVGLLECLFSLGFADMDQDELLNQTEYVSFVNYRSNKWFDGFLYTELPTVLQVNFVALANNNRQGGLQGIVFQNTANKENINVTGYNYPDENVSSEQLDFLQLVCRQTDQVLESLTGLVPPNVSPTPTTMAPTTKAPSTPPPAPTMTPTATTTTTAPTNSSLEFQIVSNFDISNTASLTASNLVGSTDQEDLRQAYDMTAVQVVERIQTQKEEQPSPSASDLRYLRKKNRRLVVEYVVDSGTIDSIEDTPCPASAAASTLCQSVAASFSLLVMNETVFDENLYTTEINDAIRSGELQQHLDKVNPNSHIVIGVPEGTSTETETNCGSSNMNAENVDGQIILIVLVTIAGSVVLVVGTVCFIDRRKKKRVKQERQQPQDVMDGPAVIATSQIVQSRSQDFSKPTQQQPQDGIPSEQWPRENSSSGATRATLGPTHDQDHVAPPPPQHQHSGVHDQEESSCLSAEVIHYDDSLSQVLEHIDNNEMYLPIEGSVSSEEADWTPPFRQIT